MRVLEISVWLATMAVLVAARTIYPDEASCEAACGSECYNAGGTAAAIWACVRKPVI
jgi:hypothetical protein